jgi:hypothetical protein
MFRAAPSDASRGYSSEAEPRSSKPSVAGSIPAARSNMLYSGVAQLAARPTLNRQVEGSSPSPRASPVKPSALSATSSPGADSLHRRADKSSRSKPPRACARYSGGRRVADRGGRHEASFADRRPVGARTGDNRWVSCRHETSPPGCAPRRAPCACPRRAGLVVRAGPHDRGTAGCDHIYLRLHY